MGCGCAMVYEKRGRVCAAGLRASGRMSALMRLSLSSQASSGVRVVAGRSAASGAMLRGVIMRFSFWWLPVLSVAAYGKGNGFWLGVYAFWF